MALPTFFIIGAGKAGTTSLHHYLSLHPQIQMSINKEPNFFAGPENGMAYKVGRVDTLEKYERLFDSRADMRGEASPSYSSYPLRNGVPERIKQLVPEARFIYLVRDPIARTVSHYQHQVGVGDERRPLREVLKADSDPARVPEICYSLYASQLDQYLTSYSEDRVLVVDQADLLTARDETLREIFGFLTVDETFTCPEFADEHYKSSERRAYPRGYERFASRVVVPLARRVPMRLRRSVRRSAERVLFPPLEKPSLDNDLRAWLEELYTDEVERLRSTTGKPFSSWSI